MLMFAKREHSIVPADLNDICKIHFSVPTVIKSFLAVDGGGYVLHCEVIFPPSAHPSRKEKSINSSSQEAGGKLIH